MTIIIDTRSALASTGYWTPERMQIWHGMTPEQRDFDRYQGQYPPGQSYCETLDGQAAIDQRADDREFERERQHTCTCHISPPCSHCTDCDECTDTAP